MEFINHTPYSSLFFRTVLKKERLAAAVMVRVGYDLKSGTAIPENDPVWPLSETPWESDYGPMESDMVFRKGGVDVLIYGKARAKNNIPVRQMDVKVSWHNQLRQRLTVSGNRYWKKSTFGIKNNYRLFKTEPEPFLEMPLTLFNTYGGKAIWDGLEIPYGNNPFGTGYYWNKEEATGNKLPNVEDPDFLIEKWDDRPDPIGVVQCPMNGLRAMPSLEQEEGTITKMKATYFNIAFPKMVASELIPGDQINIEGMTPSGLFTFTIPDNNLYMRLQLGEHKYEKKLFLDQVGVFPDLKKAFITYRFPFRYAFTAMQERVCEIFEKT